MCGIHKQCRDGEWGWYQSLTTPLCCPSLLTPCPVPAGTSQGWGKALLQHGLLLRAARDLCSGCAWSPTCPSLLPRMLTELFIFFFFNSYFTNSTASCVLYPIGVIAVTIFNRLAYISFALGDGIIRQRNRHGFLQYWGVLLSIHKHSFFVKIKQNRLTRNNYSQYGQNYLLDCISIHPICPVRFWLTWG